MDGGIFACPDGWEFLLPEGVAHLRDMGAVCARRWRLLGLTPTGCRILAGERVEAELLLAPGDCSLAGFSAGTVVTYGLSPRDSMHYPFQPDGAGAVRPAGAAAGLRRRAGAAGISHARCVGAANAPAVGGRAAVVDRLTLSSVRNGAFTGSFWRRPVRSTRKPP